MGFAEWKCHIHNHNHVVELLLPTTEITEHLLKNVVLILLKSSRLHSLQEILDPCLKTGVQLLCIKCIKSKCMLSLDLGSYNWGLFSSHLCEFPQGTRRQEYRLCVLVYGLVSGYSYWEGKKMTPQQTEYTPNWELFEGSFWKKKSLLRTGKRRQGQLSRYIKARYQQFFYALSIPCPDLLLLGMLFPSIQRCLKSCHNTGWEIFLLLLSHALNSKGNLAEGKMVIPRQFQELLYCQVEK